MSSDNEKDVKYNIDEGDVGYNDDDDYDDLFEIRTQMHQEGLKSYYDRYLLKNKIDLQPEYQRDFVWNEDKRDLLIDSIMRGFVIPQFVLIETDKKKYECIDGQHRLTVIKHFISGEKLKGKHVRWITRDKDGNKEYVYYEENKYTKDIKKRHKRFMTEKEIEKFNSFALSICKIVETKTLTFQQKSLIFSRLQNGEKTSNMDRLKNINHPLTNLIRYLETKIIEKFNQTKIGKQMNYIFKNNIEGKISCSKKKLFSNMIMRFMLIAYKGIDSITSYLDLNMYKYIEIGSHLVSLPEGIEIKDMCNKLENFLDFLVKIYETYEYFTIPEHIFYIIADIYHIKYNSKMDISVLIHIIDNELFNKYLVEDNFCKQGKIPSQKKYMEVRDEIYNICN